jgi:hypothetical protein
MNKAVRWVRALPSDPHSTRVDGAASIGNRVCVSVCVCRESYSSRPVCVCVCVVQSLELLVPLLSVCGSRESYSSLSLSLSLCVCAELLVRLCTLLE